MDINKVLIIGSGPAGYTAAIYAARADLAPILISGSEPGGQLMQTTEVENWPGEPEGILGSELMDNLKKQAERFGTRFMSDTVIDVDFSERPFKVRTNDKEFFAETIIIATGASARWLGVPGEVELKGKGMSACATCDGFFFRDKKVAVVGGGDSALEEATFLTKFASEVVVIHRRDELRASKIMQARAMENPKISFVWNTEVREVLGQERLTGLRVFNNQTNVESIMEFDGVFSSIGHKPNTDIFAGKLELDVKGYIKRRPDSASTNVEGVFVAGDVADPWYRQAITAAGTGCMAALEAERYLAARE
ncbi:MAG: thioredoxin-disulfide reductase [Candidatus Uhrbacteria bacterium]|nr:thioredoxin-disulfide reductase [Candidatus Uhrbacteria bacterium]